MSAPPVLAKMILHKPMEVGSYNNSKNALDKHRGIILTIKKELLKIYYPMDDEAVYQRR